MKHLGDIVCAASTAQNNQTTATTFAIPVGALYLVIEVVADLGASGDICYVEFGATDAFQTTTSTGLAFPSGSPLNVPVPGWPNPVVSLLNGNGSSPKTFRIFAASGMVQQA